MYQRSFKPVSYLSPETNVIMEKVHDRALAFANERERESQNEYREVYLAYSVGFLSAELDKALREKH